MEGFWLALGAPIVVAGPWKAAIVFAEERRSGELETAAAAKEPDTTAFVRSCREIRF